jgi:hypothetical protein
MAVFVLPAIPPTLAALGKAAAFVGSALGFAYVANEGINAMSSGEENADSKAQEKLDTAPIADTCVGDCGGSDPCAGLRKQLDDHRRKLEHYIKNPYAHDNKGFLGQGRDEIVIAARIRSLQHQISNFEKQLKACEEKNAK